MASPYIPVETILKVDDTEIIIEADKRNGHLTSVPASSISVGTQCEWKLEQSNNLNHLLDVEKSDSEPVVSEISMLLDKNVTEIPMAIRSWPMHPDSNVLSDQKVLIPSMFSHQLNLSSVQGDEKFLLQFDYKTRNKYKTKQRRMDPLYRSQERVRQRTVMRLKRQDPGFRAAEREKGRYRMRLKRLDPEFRSQERERQRERMKAKRSDPEFREKEREQQKTRLHVKRLNPEFNERDRIKMCIKGPNIYSNMHSNSIQIYQGNENISIVSDKILKNTEADPSKPETFHFKKQQILNFNFYKESRESGSKSRLSNLNENAFRMLNIDASKSDFKIAENLINVKLNDELPILELQRPVCSSDNTKQ